MKRAFVVVDLGFGDAGKGAVTDALARRHEIDLVVRFNGGAQAGHNVVTAEGGHHTFAQFGAATLVRERAVRTLLSRFVVVHPTALLVEARHLEEKGVAAALDRVFVDERALVTTPLHQAACRIRERARGAGRHGSCGVGVGETVADALADPETAVVARDLRTPRALTEKLRRLRERKRSDLAPLVDAARDHDEWRAFDDDAVLERFVDACAPVAPRVVSPASVSAILGRSSAAVFEGAQGVLLDEDHGFHPHTTWSRCTFANALALVAEHRLECPVERIGVLRAYAVRHGAGPFPTEDAALAVGERHNADGPWQGAFRFGHLDPVLLRYAVAACGGVDGLALTHLDELDGRHGVAVGYRGAAEDSLVVRDGERIVGLCPVARGDLAHAERLGRALREVTPILEPMPDPLAAVERALGLPPAILGFGPTAADYRL